MVCGVCVHTGFRLFVFCLRTPGVTPACTRKLHIREWTEERITSVAAPLPFSGPPKILLNFHAKVPISAPGKFPSPAGLFSELRVPPAIPALENPGIGKPQPPPSRAPDPRHDPRALVADGWLKSLSAELCYHARTLNFQPILTLCAPLRRLFAPRVIREPQVLWPPPPRQAPNPTDSHLSFHDPNVVLNLSRPFACLAGQLAIRFAGPPLKSSLALGRGRIDCASL